ncbi:MAG: hypothetical protein K6T30_04475 [Alicyclobacillus sp.]|nr:hypothetical protein [Alicyclobacillus sp.]
MPNVTDRMRKRTTLRRLMKGALAASVLFGGAVGCSPAPQPMADVVAPAQPGVQAGELQAADWSAVEHAVQLGERSLVYKEKIAVQVSVGSIHSGFTVYGSVNAPDRASIGLHVNSDNFYFYQQGESAYAQTNLRWGQVPALSNLDVFPSFERLIQAARAAGVPVYREAQDEFVIDEYCAVYHASVPARLVPAFRDWGGVSPGDMSDVSYTFYIGQKDGQLREVTSDSVGQVQDVGAMQIHSDLELFDLGQEQALVSIPKSLFGSLLSPSN